MTTVQARKDIQIFSVSIFTILALVGLIGWCRWLDIQFQSTSASFPIESCVRVDLNNGVLEYEMTSRCALVVKSFKAGWAAPSETGRREFQFDFADLDGVPESLAKIFETSVTGQVLGELFGKNKCLMTSVIRE